MSYVKLSIAAALPASLPNSPPTLRKQLQKIFYHWNCLNSHVLLLHNSSFMRSLHPKQNRVYLDSSQQPIIHSAIKMRTKSNKQTNETETVKSSEG